MTFRYRLLSPVVLVLFLIGCASKPVIDNKGVDMQAYEQDLAECQDIVEQLESGKTIAKSAAFGAAVVGAISLIAGGDATVDATIGGIQGGAAGGLKTDDEKFRVLKNCLTNRGYTVLN